MAIWAMRSCRLQVRNYTNKQANEQFQVLGSRKEGNVLFNDALNTFYLRLYGVRHMVKDHSDSEKGNPLPAHGLLFPINSKGSFICTIHYTTLHYTILHYSMPSYNILHYTTLYYTILHYTILCYANTILCYATLNYAMLY